MISLIQACAIITKPSAMGSTQSDRIAMKKEKTIITKEVTHEIGGTVYVLDGIKWLLICEAYDNMPDDFRALHSFDIFFLTFGFLINNGSHTVKS
jgi:hypothetical protein